MLMALQSSLMWLRHENPNLKEGVLNAWKWPSDVVVVSDLLLNGSREQTTDAKEIEGAAADSCA